MAREFFHLKKLVTLVSWLTSMLVKQQQLSVFFTILVKSIKSVKHTKVLHKWTGWNKSKERGITITSAATTAQWKDYRVNIIDTPARGLHN